MSIMRKLTSYAIAAIAIGTFALGSADAGQYSKPTSSFSAPSYSKPAPVYTPAPSFKPSAPVVAAPSNSNSGYTKPSVATEDKSTAPSNSYTKPPLASATPVAPLGTVSSTPSNNGYSKPGATPAPVASAAPQTYKSQVYNPSNALSASSSKAMSNDSLKQYQAERAAARNPPQPVDVGSVRRDPSFTSATSRYTSVDSYMTARNTNIVVYRNAHPDVYIYTGNMYPNYGAYDSGFLVGMTLGYVGSAAANNAWLYAHMNDPWYNQYHADMVHQAQDNAELRAKLEAQDAELARIRASGVEPNPRQGLPAGVDPSVAIAPEAMIANASISQESNEESHFARNAFIILLVLVIGAGGYFYFVGRN